MKKIMLGLVAAFALTTVAAPAFAGEEAAGDKAPAADAPAGAEKTK